MASTETEEKTQQDEGNEAAGGESGARKALKVGALAAAAGTAAFAANKAMSSGESGSESRENGSPKSGAKGGVDQIVAAIGDSRWDVLRDMIVPFAESGARSVGAFVAKDTPAFVGDHLIPKFIEGFNQAKESSD